MVIIAMVVTSVFFAILINTWIDSDDGFPPEGWL